MIDVSGVDQLPDSVQVSGFAGLKEISVGIGGGDPERVGGGAEQGPARGGHGRAGRGGDGHFLDLFGVIIGPFCA